MALLELCDPPNVGEFPDRDLLLLREDGFGREMVEEADAGIADSLASRADTRRHVRLDVWPGSSGGRLDVTGLHWHRVCGFAGRASLGAPNFPDRLLLPKNLKYWLIFASLLIKVASEALS
jgi:hypothetical protein